jgi:hypothetical protein
VCGQRWQSAIPHEARGGIEKLSLTCELRLVVPDPTLFTHHYVSLDADQPTGRGEQVTGC